MAWTEAQKRYARSEKGKAARKRYQESEKGKAARARYMASLKEKQPDVDTPEDKKEEPINIEKN